MAQLTTTARPYAKAAFKAAQEAGDLQGWSARLNLLAALTQQEKIAAFMANPALSGERKAQVLCEICGDELGRQQQNLVHLLAANKRLPLLPEIAVLFEGLKAEQERTVEVEVVSAYDLDSNAEAQLVQALKQRLQRDVRVSSRTDKSLIGGVVVRAGDLVIDGSVRGKLKKLHETIKA